MKRDKKFWILGFRLYEELKTTTSELRARKAAKKFIRFNCNSESSAHAFNMQFKRRYKIWCAAGKSHLPDGRDLGGRTKSDLRAVLKFLGAQDLVLDLDKIIIRKRDRTRRTSKKYEQLLIAKNLLGH